jgi:hypothetical protein
MVRWSGDGGHGPKRLLAELAQGVVDAPNKLAGDRQRRLLAIEALARVEVVAVIGRALAAGALGRLNPAQRSTGGPWWEDLPAEPRVTDSKTTAPGCRLFYLVVAPALVLPEMKPASMPATVVKTVSRICTRAASFSFLKIDTKTAPISARVAQTRTTPNIHTMISHILFVTG